MTLTPFIPKDDQELPDCYSLTINFVNGKMLEVEVAQHKTIDHVKIPDSRGPFFSGPKNTGGYRLEPHPNPFLEYVTKDDLWAVAPWSSIQSIQLDKRWSKIVSIRKKKFEETLQKQQSPE